MAPKAAAGSLTDRDMEHLRNYLRCLKTKPEVDIDKFAALSGSTTASARTIINRLLNKVAAEETPDTPSNKDNDGEDAEPETPATGKKKGAGRKRKGDVAEGDTAENSPLKKKATPRKAKGKALADAAKSGDEPSPVKQEVVDEATEDGA